MHENRVRKSLWKRIKKASAQTFHCINISFVSSKSHTHMNAPKEFHQQPWKTKEKKIQTKSNRKYYFNQIKMGKSVDKFIRFYVHFEKHYQKVTRLKSNKIKVKIDWFHVVYTMPNEFGQFHRIHWWTFGSLIWLCETWVFRKVERNKKNTLTLNIWNHCTHAHNYCPARFFFWHIATCKRIRACVTVVWKTTLEFS